MGLSAPRLRWWRAAGRGMIAFCVLLIIAWSALALWYQLPWNAWVNSVAVVAWLSFGIFIIVSLVGGRIVLPLCAFAVAFALLLCWWHSLQPSNDRIWADDVAQISSGEVAGNQVTLHNVRNFEWRGETDYTQNWETRVYDLDQLDSVDMIMSYWSGKAIAHMLVSFGFRDGQHVVFSVEVRREKSEGYSEIGGYFKEFELSIIAADERDVVRVRTNVRGEDDYLYRIQLPMAVKRSLFLAYVGEANKLASTPRFYDTVTANCTTLVYHMMQHIVGHLPLRYPLLLTGYLPEYVRSLGALDARYTFDQLQRGGRITDRAHAADASPTFSADIRRGVPGIETP